MSCRSTSLCRLSVDVTLEFKPLFLPMPRVNLSEPSRLLVLRMVLSSGDCGSPSLLWDIFVVRRRKYLPKRALRDGAQAQTIERLHSATEAAKTLKASQNLSSTNP